MSEYTIQKKSLLIDFKSGGITIKKDDTIIETLNIDDCLQLGRFLIAHYVDQTEFERALLRSVNLKNKNIKNDFMEEME